MFEPEKVVTRFNFTFTSEVINQSPSEKADMTVKLCCIHVMLTCPKVKYILQSSHATLLDSIMHSDPQDNKWRLIVKRITCVKQQFSWSAYSHLHPMVVMVSITCLDIV